MSVWRQTMVKQAAQETIRELDLLKVELDRIKKMLLNGHHDVQIESGISINLKEKPNGAGNSHD